MHGNTPNTKHERHNKTSALEAFANVAILKNTGARGLRAIMERVLIDAMFLVPELSNSSKDDGSGGSEKTRLNAVVVTEDTVVGNAGVLMLKGDMTLGMWIDMHAKKAEESESGWSIEEMIEGDERIEQLEELVV